MWLLTLRCGSLCLCPRSPGHRDRGTCPAVSPNTGHVVWGYMTGLLTHGLRGLLLLLQLPLQGGHLHLEVTCFCAAKRKSLQRFPWAWMVAFLPSGGSHHHVEGPPGLVGKLCSGVRKPRPPPTLLPIGWLPCLYTSVSLRVRHRSHSEAQKGSDLPKALRPHISGHWLTST